MRRLFWMGVGAVAGASGTIWAERKVRSQLDALAPDHLVVTAGNRARDAGRSVLDALAEGRDAMREREHELRDASPGARGPRPTSAHTHASGRDVASRSRGGAEPLRPRGPEWVSSSRRHR